MSFIKNMVYIHICTKAVLLLELGLVLRLLNSHSKGGIIANKLVLSLMIGMTYYAIPEILKFSCKISINCSKKAAVQGTVLGQLPWTANSLLELAHFLFNTIAWVYKGSAYQGVSEFCPVQRVWDAGSLAPVTCLCHWLGHLWGCLSLDYRC